jgi:hypothetical protein
MTVTPEESIRLALASLSPTERQRCTVYLDTAVQRKGDVLRAGSQAIRLPSDAFVFFADLEPGANWSHPSRVILVNQSDGTVDSRNVRLPPPSETLQIVHRPPEIEPWMLLNNQQRE